VNVSLAALSAIHRAFIARDGSRITWSV
jgi:hypothetical protein